MKDLHEARGFVQDAGDEIKSSSRLGFSIEHDLLGKPLRTLCRAILGPKTVL